MADNWYIVLDLEFDPNPVTDEAVIAERIEEKKKFWSRNANDFKNGQTYKRYTENLATIKKEMIGPENIRDRLIKEAIVQVYEPVDRTLKSFHTQEVSMETLKKLAAKQKVDIEIVKRRAKALGIKIVAGEESLDTYQATYDKYMTKPANTDKYNGMAPLMNTFRVNNLYDFLFQGTSVKNPRSLACKDLVAKAEQLKTEKFFRHDAVASDGSKLCSLCKETFADEASKKGYDAYLYYISISEVITDATNAVEIMGQISPEGYEDFIKRLTAILRSQQEAEKLMTAFCKIRKIQLPVAAGKKEVNPKMKVCRCGCMNDTSDGRKICMNCGMSLQIKCPKCGNLCDNNINVCKCGFAFENLDKSNALCELASSSLDDMNFDLAQMQLADAERFWKENPQIPGIRSRLKDQKDRLGTIMQDMVDACKQKNYYAAKRILDNIRSIAPTYSAPDKEAEIQGAIDLAEDFKKKAQATTDEAQIISFCEKAYEACKDCPGVREMIAKYPPKAPKNLAVSTDPNSHVNHLRWFASGGGTVFYHVVRKENAVPINEKDGILVGRTSMTNISDQGIKAGVPYYYAIFAERAGIMSPALVNDEPVINLFEISGVNLTAGDGQVRIEWSMIPAANASVLIEKSQAGGAMQRKLCTSRSEYADTDVLNDTEYTYRVFLEYTVGAKKIATTGVTVIGIPTCPPRPIEKMTMKPGENDTFFLEWDNPENAQIMFFYATGKKPDYYESDIVSVSELKSKLHSLIVNKTGNNAGNFKFPGDDVFFVIPVAVKGDSGVIGTMVRGSKGGGVKINSVSVINGQIMMLIEPPKHATGFVVLYRMDQYPEGLEDTKTVRKYIPLKKFTYDGGLIIDSAASGNYYFSVFAEFKVDGDSDYSVGTEYLFENGEKKTIFYSIKVVKKFLRGAEAQITFTCEDKNLSLPDIDIVSAVGRVPMFKKECDLFYQVPSGPMSNGKLVVEVEIPHNAKKGTNIKPFLAYEQLASQFILKSQLDSDNEIVK